MSYQPYTPGATSTYQQQYQPYQQPSVQQSQNRGQATVPVYQAQNNQVFPQYTSQVQPAQPVQQITQTQYKPQPQVQPQHHHVQSSQSNTGGHQHYHKQSGEYQDDEDMEEFEALKIPACWDEAKEHADARKTGAVLDVDHHERKFCKCCGFQVQRQELEFLEHGTIELKFLGSGFPLFYNFIKYCMLILFVFICISGTYNLYTNSLGHNCDHDDLLFATHQNNLNIDYKKEIKTCHKNFAHTYSLVNKLNATVDGEYYNTADKYLPTQHILNTIVAGVIMIILVIFRYSQRKLDADIDDEQTTPSDFTIMVKNIPKKVDCDYEAELRKIFTYKVVRNTQKQIVPMNVTAINLVYDIDHILELEEALMEVVKKKQEFLEKHGFKTDDPVLDDWDEEIEHIEHRIHKIEKNIPLDQQDYFTGTAFISFQTEVEKDQVVDQNTYTYWEQVRSYFNGGKLSQYDEEDLTWDDNKLFIEEAPEPDDVDWEFIHFDTKRKIFARIKAWFKTLLFLAACYIGIWGLTKYQGNRIEAVYEQLESGNVSMYNYYVVRFMSFAISMGIVFFNKFVLGKVFHIIVDEEYYSTKTKFNIAFAFKLTIGLFVNSALLAYFVEILGEKNFYGPGGFIYTETWVFIWNCILPPTVWLIDPWTIQKNGWRKNHLKEAKEGKCYLTQQEANKMMENVEYTQGKRYADIMKTMWFTFFYAPAIPLGLFFSFANLIYYFWIDQYNVMKRRTIKETLSKEVSIEMIENLELCIIFYAIGNCTFSYLLFNDIDKLGIYLGIAAVIYALLPMQEINEYLFEITRKPEEKTYAAAEKSFVTNYDRLNPITKKHALKKLKQELVKAKKRYTERISSQDLQGQPQPYQTQPRVISNIRYI